MKTLLGRARCRALCAFLFQDVVVPKGAGRPGALGVAWSRGAGALRHRSGRAGRWPEGVATNVLARSRVWRLVALADDLDPAAMTDNGMWVWSGIIAVVSLAASYFVALWWQRWRSRA